MSDPIVFEDWEAVLKAELPQDQQRRYREAIVKFRYWLREKGKKPVPDIFKEHLDWKQSYLSPERFEIRRAALRWYYKTGLKRMRNRAVSRSATGSSMLEARGQISGDAASFSRAAKTTAPARQTAMAGSQIAARNEPDSPLNMPMVTEARSVGGRGKPEVGSKHAGRGIK